MPRLAESTVALMAGTSQTGARQARKKQTTADPALLYLPKRGAAALADPVTAPSQTWEKVSLTRAKTN